MTLTLSVDPYIIQWHILKELCDLLVQWFTHENAKINMS